MCFGTIYLLFIYHLSFSFLIFHWPFLYACFKSYKYWFLSSFFPFDLSFFFLSSFRFSFFLPCLFYLLMFCHFFVSHIWIGEPACLFACRTIRAGNPQKWRLYVVTTFFKGMVSWGFENPVLGSWGFKALKLFGFVLVMSPTSCGLLGSSLPHPPLFPGQFSWLGVRDSPASLPRARA